jgi:hypothetical protein
VQEPSLRTGFRFGVKALSPLFESGVSLSAEQITSIEVEEDHMSNPCLHFLIAMGNVENAIRSVESTRESPAQQKTLKTLQEQLEALAKQYEACTRGPQ